MNSQRKLINYHRTTSMDYHTTRRHGVRGSEIFTMTMTDVFLFRFIYRILATICLLCISTGNCTIFIAYKVFWIKDIFMTWFATKLNGIIISFCEKNVFINKHTYLFKINICKKKISVLSEQPNLRELCPRDIAIDPKYVWTYGSVCLQLSLDKHDWPHARERCQRHGGDLVQIRSADMQGSIIEKIRQSHSHIKTGFWIGASDQHHEGLWEWVAGQSDAILSWKKNQRHKKSLSIHVHV